jgi:hypothetical protein
MLQKRKILLFTVLITKNNDKHQIIEKEFIKKEKQE